MFVVNKAAEIVVIREGINREQGVLHRVSPHKETYIWLAAKAI